MTRAERRELSGWGRYPRSRSFVLRPVCAREVAPPCEGQMIARGQGRCYGDAAQVEGGSVMMTERLARFKSFDEETGWLRAEAGATLAQVLAEFLPRGWFPKVTPGTKHVSLGGCVAADVHGKNHHRDGTFGAHVRGLEIVLADGTRARCSPDENAPLFRAAVGGMGLTGVITEVECRLSRVESAYMIVQHRSARDLDASIELLESDAWDDSYTVAWVDCLARGASLGRGVFMRGHHATAAELPANVVEPLKMKARAEVGVPFDLPGWFLNRAAARAFNELYYRRQGARREPFLADYESFFYPLDRLGDWNRLYGGRGFVQYQCVLPTAGAREGLRALLERIALGGYPCFLAVLKRFGPEGEGLLSFPLEGYTLALDLPLGDPGLFAFLDGLDLIVLEHGGRVYLAKDARMKAETFRAMHSRLPEWRRVKALVDPENRFTSDLARRLGL
ncbi:MAG TPA: FAD-binding oxidoreductase [Pyrinomonadaceae bacterium]